MQENPYESPSDVPANPPEMSVVLQLFRLVAELAIYGTTAVWSVILLNLGVSSDTHQFPRWQKTAFTLATLFLGCMATACLVVRSKERPSRARVLNAIAGVIALM